MRVNSTGLGKTTLTAHISELAPDDDAGVLTMKIESTRPVHWYITCRMEPGDIRAAIRMVLRPSVIARVIKMALSRGAKNEGEGDVTAPAASKAS